MTTDNQNKIAVEEGFEDASAKERRDGRWISFKAPDADLSADELAKWNEENVHWKRGEKHVVKVVDAFWLKKGSKKGRAIFVLETRDGETLFLSERDQLRPLLEMGVNVVVQITPTEKVTLANSNTMWKFNLQKKKGTGHEKKTLASLVKSSKRAAQERASERDEEPNASDDGEDIPF